MKRFRIALLAATLTCGAALAGSPAYPPFGLNLSWLDKSVKPGDDFFLYANGNWAKTATIPADRTYNGVNYELNTQNEERLKAILTDLNARAAEKLGPDERKLRDLAAAYLDEAQIEQRGLDPAKADLARIAAAASLKDVAALMADPALDLDGPFGIYLSTDDKHPDHYAVRLVQSGLGLPDRDYYLRTDKVFADTRTAYKDYMVKMLTLAGSADAEARATALLTLETEIAKVSWPGEERRDPDKMYNPMDIGALASLAPDFPWRDYLAAAGISANGPKGPRQLLVSEKSAFPKLAAIFAATPPSVWRDYLTLRYLQRFAAVLPKAVDDTTFEFYGKAIQGRTQQLPRLTRALHLLDTSMGEALGRLYVERHFPPAAKAKAVLLVKNMLAAYAADIKTLSWMTPETRRRALAKLNKIMVKVGYPDHWRDYTALSVSRDDLIGDMKNTSRFRWQRELNRLDGPVDRTEWGMTPPTNNAYYNPTLNEIVFPAGILQPPFFDPNADDAVNYGEIGATIGHEISHGFDDEGANFDADGVLTDWWTPADKAAFQARTAALADQYDAYEPLPGIHIKGKLTNGENIADLAGLVIAHKAYILSLHGKHARVLAGMTGDQRFYIAYSQSWRQQDRPGALRAQLLANPHSPPDYRVNGVVRNDDGWYAAFPEIKAGDKYYLPPEKRVRLW